MDKSNIKKCGNMNVFIYGNFKKIGNFTKISMRL